VEALATFCTVEGTSPDALLAAARDDLAPVLTAAEQQGTSLVVQSFLIHNGLNVFGAIVCMPHTADQLAEQGERWAPGARGRQGQAPSDTAAGWPEPLS
jgi:hypothetical protein